MGSVAWLTALPPRANRRETAYVRRTALWPGDSFMTTNDGNDDASRAAASPPKAAKIVKRYSNRKLYDTERSKYVTLDEIAKMIKAGEEVTIIDNESKEDLTSVTLTQIIFEEEKRESRMPLSMLRNLIQSGGETLQGFFDRSVKAPVAEIKDTATKSVEELRQAATRSVSEWTDTARRVFIRQDAEKRAEEFKKAYTSSLDELTKRIEARTKELAHMQSEAAAEAKGEAKDGVQDTGQAAHRVQEDVDALRERLHQLSKLIDELEQSQRTPIA
jgi:polyhydroxyalkanoate synthesis repressor PhaR